VVKLRRRNRRHRRTSGRARLRSTGRRRNGPMFEKTDAPGGTGAQPLHDRESRPLDHLALRRSSAAAIRCRLARQKSAKPEEARAVEAGRRLVHLRRLNRPLAPAKRTHLQSTRPRSGARRAERSSRVGRTPTPVRLPKPISCPGAPPSRCGSRAAESWIRHAPDTPWCPQQSPARSAPDRRRPVAPSKGNSAESRQLTWLGRSPRTAALVDKRCPRSTPTSLSRRTREGGASWRAIGSRPAPANVDEQHWRPGLLLVVYSARRECGVAPAMRRSADHSRVEPLLDQPQDPPVSQRAYVTWERMDLIAARWLPPARILHPWPETRFAATTRGRSPESWTLTLESERGAARSPAWTTSRTAEGHSLPRIPPGRAHGALACRPRGRPGPIPTLRGRCSSR
jgi:hypothetical protein